MSASGRHIIFVQAGLGAGGAEKIVNLLSRHRTLRGDRVTVLAMQGTPSRSFFDYPGDVQVLTMSADNGFGMGARIAWLRRMFKELAPDLVVSFLTKVNVLVLAAAIGLRVPVAVSERNNPARQKMHPLWPVLTRALLWRAQALVMQTSAICETLPPRHRARSVVIGNPCAIEGATDSPVPDRGPSVVAVGRLTGQKGFDLLIDAFARVVASKQDASLTIWGEGEDRQELEAQIKRLGLSRSIRLPGLSAQPFDWVESGGIFVLSSRYEGFPNVLAEAMASGHAAIAFDCPYGPSSLIVDGETGRLIKEDDVDAMAEAILMLMSDPAERMRLARAAKTGSERFALSQILAQWDELIDGLLEVRIA